MSTTVGIDIGFETIKLVGLDRAGSGWKLRGMNLVKCPPSSWQADALIHTDELAVAIVEALKKARPHSLPAKKVMMVLPESVIFASTFAMPSMPRNDLLQALPFAIAEKLSIDIEEYHYDFEELTSRCHPLVSEGPALAKKPTENAPEKPETKTGQPAKDPVMADETPQVTIFAVAAKKSLIESVEELCRKAKLELAGIDVKPGAIARAAVKKNDQKARLIVDMGVGGTGVSIAEGKSLRVTSTVPWGTHSIAEHITAIVPNLREKAAPVFDELVHVTKFFENRVCPGVHIEELIISGTGANIPNIVEVFSQETGLPTKLAEPFANIALGSFKVPVEMTHTFSDCIGLAMRS